MMKIIKRLFFGSILMFLLALTLTAGVLLSQMGYIPRVVPAFASGPTEDMAVFWEAWHLIRDNYVDRTALTDPSKLEYAAIRGMAEELGDTGHTRFLSPDEANGEQEHLEGKFFGIGAYLGVDEQDRPFIITPFDGSPASEAGIRAGDVILQVDGVDVIGLTLDEVVSRIKGDKGTEVTLTILHETADAPVDITVVRDEIRIPAVSWAMIPGTDIGFIRISQFSSVADDQLVSALEAAKQDGASALVVDVRSDGGGLLDQAIKVSSEFLVDGDVLLERNAQDEIKKFPVKKGGVAVDLPMVVLVDRGTASAAEIFAGAIQDQNRATVIGETTFGAGTVLTPYTLSDGSMLLLGTSEWLTPDGRHIWKNGVAPDVELSLAEGEHLLTPDDVREMTPDELQQANDPQLNAAIEALK